jgi:hypothetical protein
MFETNKLDNRLIFMLVRILRQFTYRLFAQRHFCSRNRENFPLNIDFPAVKNKNRIAFKIMKACR